MINFLKPRSERLKKYRMIGYLIVMVMGAGIYFIYSPLMPVLSDKVAEVDILPTNLDPAEKQMQDSISRLPSNLIVSERLTVDDKTIVESIEDKVTTTLETQKIQPKTRVLGATYNKQAVVELQKPVSKENRIVIPKMGVNDKILEDQNADVLWKGIWRMPVGSTPDAGGNTIITAHRYLHKPPSTKTFYLIDKLVPGDMVTVYWEGREYRYQVKSSKIVEPSEVSILHNTTKAQLTLFSCTPLYTSKQRLVVIAELL